LGIVIPALNEEEGIPGLLDDLAQLSIPHQVIVSDGGSRDGTKALALETGATVVDAPPGRASQMNAGARGLETPWVLFLHADSRMPLPSRQALEVWLQEAGPREFGTFAFAFDAQGPLWRLMEGGQWIREGVLGLAYGDQGLLVHRTLLNEVGGFPDLPLMEDVEMLRRLRKGGRWKKIRAPLLTHPRRFQEDGALFAWLRNVLLVSLYQVGVPPAGLSRFYPARKAPSLPTLVIMAKAPRPGRVKTRLAKALGAQEAARVYSLLARRVVDQLRSGPYRTVLSFDPPGEREAVEGWLGGEDLTLLPQAPGELGARLEAAAREALEVSPTVVLVGTDAPGVTEGLVREALGALKENDLVLGPATDGGYYLIGMSTLHRELFQGIPWSTQEVLGTTLDRANALGLRTTLLPPLQDVDTLEDWERVKTTLDP
jgi:rSAM/selenodomain-associated transferase 2/rSAM/selenodomain-associated transferase 1